MADNADGEGDKHIQVGRKISGHQLILNVVRESMVEGIQERGSILVALLCYGAELVGAVRHGSPSLCQVEQTSNSLSSRCGMILDLTEFGGEQLDQ